MSPSKSIGIVAALALIIACFLPWVKIPIGNIDITGMNTAGTGFGKPGIIHLALSLIFLACLLVNKTWSKRLNILVVAINSAWALRNMIIIPACHMGSCPEKYLGLYLVILASAFMLLAALLVDVQWKKSK